MDEATMFTGKLIAERRPIALRCIRSVSEQLIRLGVRDFEMQCGQSGKNKKLRRWRFMLHLPKTALEGKPKNLLLEELAKWVDTATEGSARTIKEAISLLEQASFLKIEGIRFHTMFSVKDGVGYMLSVDGVVDAKALAQYSKVRLKGTQLEAIGNTFSAVFSELSTIEDSLKQIERRIKLHELVDAR